MRIQDFDFFPKMLAALEQLPTDSFDEEAEEFQNIYYLKLLYYMNTFQYKEATQLIPEIKGGMKLYQSKINSAREITFYYNISILYFVKEDFENAIEWIDKILDNKNSDHRKDIQFFARVMQLIVHYELENHILLENLCRSAYRGLKKVNKLNEFESLVLKLIKKLLNTVDAKDILFLITEFRNQLEELKQTNPQNNIVGLQEIIDWADSKISGKTYMEVLKENSIS